MSDKHILHYTLRILEPILFFKATSTANSTRKTSLIPSKINKLISPNLLKLCKEKYTQPSLHYSGNMIIQRTKSGPHT